jgi:hypothetical protein
MCLQHFGPFIKVALVFFFFQLLKLMFVRADPFLIFFLEVEQFLIKCQLRVNLKKIHINNF